MINASYASAHAFIALINPLFLFQSSERGATKSVNDNWRHQCIPLPHL